MATVEISHLRSLVTARLNQRYPPKHSRSRHVWRALRSPIDSEMRIPGHRTLRTRDEALTRGIVEVDDDNYAKLVELVESGSD